MSPVQHAHQTDRLMQVQALTAALSQAVTSEQVADAILAHGMAVLGTNAGCVTLLSDDRQELVLLRIAGAVPDVAARWQRFPVATPVPLAQAVRERVVVVLETFAERFLRYPALEGVLSTDANGAMIALPMMVRGEVLGSLGWGWSVDRSFTDADRAFLITIAELCGQALDRARLYDRERAARERAERAEASLQETQTRLRERAEEVEKLLEVLPVAVWLARDRACRHVIGNRAGHAMLRMPTGANLSKTAPEGEQPTHFRVYRGGRELRAEELPLQHAACYGIAVYGIEEDIVFEDGAVTQVYGSATPLFDEQGAVRGAVAAFLDVSELRRAEASRRESEERLRAIIDNCPSVIFVKDPHGRYILANRACEAYANEPVARIIGKTDDDYLPREVADQFRTDDRTVLESGETLRYEEVAPLNGELRTSLTVKFPLRDADGRPIAVCGIATDITELKRAADALRESEQRLRAISDNLPLGAVYQVAGDAQGHRQFLYISAGVERLLGITRAEALADASALYSLVHEDDRDRVQADEAIALHDLAPFDCEFRSWTRTGGLIWVHVRSAPRSLPSGQVAWEGIIIDITARKQAEQALNWERELLGTIIEKIPVMLTVYEPDTKVLRLNPAFEQAIGWSTYDVVGVSLMEECYPDPEYRERVREFMQSCREGWLDLRMRTRDGGDLETSWANIKLSSGIQVGIGIDITDRKRHEEALKEADRRKDEFLATLAHELRNPLAPLRNGLQIMKLSNNPDAVAQARGMMERQLAQMVRLIDDLLDVSRITRGKLELRRQPIALATVVRSAIESSRPSIEAAAHRLTVSLPPEPIFLDGDPTRLAQVFANLLSNAAKYTDPGGHIRLRAERDGREVVIRVTDNGIGIPAEHLPRLFEMFSQVESAQVRSQGGLGIGLSLVKGLAEMHGGTVTAHSEGPGRGSEFTVRLPVTAARPVTATPADEPARRPSTRRILVADDNRDAAESLAMLLRLAGHEVHVVHDGEQAVGTACWYRPDAVLLDIGMPKLNGHEACRRIRAVPGGKQTLLVAITGWGQPEDKRKALEAGFDEHLTKPVDLTRLSKLLCDHIPAV
jgi:PAS domain S-box-containing protein